MRIPWLSPRTRTPGDSGSYRQTMTPAEMTAHENALSIHAIPLDVLPDGPARRFALSEAMAGKDVYGYASGGAAIGTWCIWYGPLVAVRSNRDGRIPARVWATDWEAFAYEAAHRQRVDLYGAPRPTDAQDVTQANGGATTRKGGAA